MGRAATFVAWALLLASAVVLWLAQAAVREGGAGEGEAEGPPLAQELAGRFTLGAARVLGAQARTNVLEGMRLEAMPPEERLRMVAVLAEISGEAEARALLERLRDKVPGPDFDAFWTIYGEGKPLKADAGFLRRNGWFARLALSRGLPDTSPLRKSVLSRATRTFLGFALTLFGGMVALVLGLVLLPMAVKQLARGRMAFLHAPGPCEPRDRVWLETVTLLLLGVTIAITVRGLTSWVMWGLVAVPFWPLARGISWSRWREGLGLFRGKGLLREAGAGIAGYIAGVPVFAAGFFLSLLVSRLLGEPLFHPAIRNVVEDNPWARLDLFLSACLWAPLVEEAVFRGAFYGYLRSRMARLLAAALTGLLFALVHPQGIAGIPVLMAIGGWFALLREWRGTLVPCVAAHAVHNLVLVSLTVLAVG